MSLFHFIPDKPDHHQLENKPLNKGSFREWLYTVIFQSNTRLGKMFDIGLMIVIGLNIILLMLESVPAFAKSYSTTFRTLDYFFIVLFSIELILRIYCVQKPKKYLLSFYGIIDVISLLPSFLEFLIPQFHALMILRSFRLLRIFRIFGMIKFLEESRYLMFTLLRSFRKILVFLFFVILLTVFLGSLMYVVEYRHNPAFSSIPESIYWAIVTITTVGYGDISPSTGLGKAIASFIMILGYAIIAVPTGIFSANFIKQNKRNTPSSICHQCKSVILGSHPNFCSQCGTGLTKESKV